MPPLGSRGAGDGRREHVQRERQGLESEEQHDQIVGGGHHHAARGRHEHQGVYLGAVASCARSRSSSVTSATSMMAAQIVIVRNLAKVSNASAPLNNVAGPSSAIVMPLEHRQPAGDERRQRRQPRVGTAWPGRRQRAEHEQEQRARHEGDQRADVPPLDRRRRNSCASSISRHPLRLPGSASTTCGFGDSKPASILDVGDQPVDRGSIRSSIGLG